MTEISLGVAFIALLIISACREWGAAVGVACYIFSVVCFNLWTFVDIPEALPMVGTSEETVAWLESYEAHVNALVAAFKVWAFGLNAVLVLYVGIVFALIMRGGDFLAKIVFGMLFVSEAYALLFENLTCNWHDIVGSELARTWDGSAACARTLHDAAVWLPTAIQCLFIAWVATLALRRYLR